MKGVLVKVVGPPATLSSYVASSCLDSDFAVSRLVFSVRLQRGDASVTRTSGERWRTGYCCASEFQPSSLFTSRMSETPLVEPQEPHFFSFVGKL